jgi:hypothetical protein
MAKKLMSHCPFCHAPAATVGSEGDRKYACGTWGDRVLGIYKKGCGPKASQLKLWDE